MSDATRSPREGQPALGIGLVGYAFMGAAHSQAWRTVNRVYDLPVAARMVAVCGRDAVKVAEAADRYGWGSTETDWKELLLRPDIDVVDVCTPGYNHAEIAIAALEAGKHVLCEKPLANTVAEARAMVEAARKARANGVFAAVGFNYRRVPAMALARQLIEAGRIGEVRHVRAVYLQDWIVDPEFPLVWRLQSDLAGSGALGDLGAHIVDLAQYLTGQRITGVSGLLNTFIEERPLPGASEGLSASGGSGTGRVTVDDAALFTARFDGGAIGSFEASRFATGRKNGMRIEVNGSLGSLAFSLETFNELEFYDGTEDPSTQGFRRILVTEPTHPYVGAWWPPGHVIGYEHSFTHELFDFLSAVGSGQDPFPSFEDGLQVQLVLDAVERSAQADSAWTSLEAL